MGMRNEIDKGVMDVEKKVRYMDSNHDRNDNNDSGIMDVEA